MVGRFEDELLEVKEQMGAIRDAFKAKATQNLDNLVHRIDSPFTAKVITYSLLAKFRIPHQFKTHIL